MRIESIGGGPAGLYLAILMKERRPDATVIVHERNRRGDTFGFGVVFSDATLGNLEEADPVTYRAITERFYHWDDIVIHARGEVTRSTGHGFAGLSRKTLLHLLEERALALGVELRFEAEVPHARDVMARADLVLAADGVNSAARAELAAELEPSVELRPNRFVWLGTTYPFDAFTFYLKERALPSGGGAGLFRVHAYRYEPGMSTFIVECTEATWRAFGLDRASEADTVRFCEETFEAELAGHRLVSNRSIWRQFPTIDCKRWHHDNLVVLGDAAHTAHFSIGSGTKLAMEDGIELARALAVHAPPSAGARPREAVARALAAYDEARRPAVRATQRAAQVSLEWFESTERYMDAPRLELAMSLLTRSLRITHENLRLRDPALVAEVDRDFARRALAKTGETLPTPVPPPMFVPLHLRELRLDNRVVVSPMCQYSAHDGEVGDWHLVHLGSRAQGGAGLVMAEMTDVTADGRITHGCAGLYDERHLPAWRRVVDFVHRHTAAKIGVQLGHAGPKGATCLMWEGMDEPLPASADGAAGGWPLVAASPLPYKPHSRVPRALGRADMDRLLAQYVDATHMAEAAGFDLLELHMAHGYLLATFVSPLTNQRTDEYGGSLEGRMRFPLEVLDAVRAAWPAHKPLSVRISATDWAEGGLSGEDSVAIARLLAAHGCDLVDVSTGQTVAASRPVFGRLFQTPFADRIRHEAGIATMAVGGISSWADVSSILTAGRADLCALGRAHLWDPYWTRHAAYEQGYPIEWPKPYEVVSARAKYQVRLR
jgi:anthraniloyl-CoA monooxygenase